MSEISKLRKRLGNATKSTSEYRMTMAEAKGLLSEIDSLIANTNKSPEVVYIETPTPDIGILDGGLL